MITRGRRKAKPSNTIDCNGIRVNADIPLCEVLSRDLDMAEKSESVGCVGRIPWLGCGLFRAVPIDIIVQQILLALLKRFARHRRPSKGMTEWGRHPATPVLSGI